VRRPLVRSSRRRATPTRAGDCATVPAHHPRPAATSYVKIQHPGGIQTLYCHLVRAPAVRVGQIVAVGQELGRVGSSGHSSGPHLHFEVRLTARQDEGDAPSPADPSPVDPVTFMRQHGVHLGSTTN
jgi:murein DD-endopeptidase MepM/ murein hydrolase activator NlpD